MAIKIQGTTIVDDSRQLSNIASIDSTTATTIENSISGGVSDNTTVVSLEEGQSAAITLENPVVAPMLSATKQLLPRRETNSGWNSVIEGSNYEQFDTAPQVDISLFEIGNWALDGAGLDVSFDFSSQEFNMKSVFFKSDGTKMYLVGYVDDTVRQYTLATAWDLSTASYDSVTFDVSGQDTDPTGVFFKSDGTKMYIVGNSSDSVHQYTLGTAWDLSTASYDSVSFSISSQDVIPIGIFFKSDGTKMYIVGYSNDSVYQYTLATAWDISSASYDSVSFDVSSQEYAPTGMFFKSDGTKMYTVGFSNRVHQYTLSTAWDISSASYDSVSFSVSGQDSDPTDIFFKSDGTKMYTVGFSNRVHQYTLGSYKSTIEFPSGGYSFTSNDVGKRIVIGESELILTDTDGSYVKDPDTPDIPRENVAAAGNWSMYSTTIESKVLTTSGNINRPFSLGSASYDSVSIATSEDSSPQGIFFKPDGTKIYMVGDDSDSVHQYTLATAWDLSTATYDSVSFNVGSQDSFPTGVSFKPDGTKMYMVALFSGVVYQYTLSTAWDLSTASYDSVSFSAGSQDSNANGIFFKSDGTKMYVVGGSNDSVYQYTLATAWDLSTASYDSVSFSVSSQDFGPEGIFFKDDGTKMYIVGYSNDSVYQYTLATAWDISSASYDSLSFSVRGQDDDPTAIFFKSDGTKMYIVGGTNDSIYQYTLSTAWKIPAPDTFSFGESGPTLFFKPDGIKMYLLSISSGSVFQYTLSTAWDLSTASYDSVSFDVSSQDSIPNGIFFKDDGTKMYIVGEGDNSVHQYTLSTAWDLSTASYDSVAFNTSSQDSSAIGIFFKPDGTKMYLVAYSGDTVYQYTLSTAWDISSTSYDSVSFNVFSQESNPLNIFFKDDGTKMYIIGTNSDSVHQYTLSTAWDLSTASYDSVSFEVADNPASISFKADGAKMYIGSNSSDTTIYEYTLATAWELTGFDLSILALEASLSVSLEGDPEGIFFKSDGTKMYMVGTNSDSVHQYTLGTAWDLSTASYDSVLFDVSGQSIYPTDVFFKSDGTKMYIVGSNSDAVYQYTLGTAWDISSASYDSVSFDVSGQDSSPIGIFFKSDGTKMYIVGASNDFIYQYTLGTAWDLSTASYDSVSFDVGSQDGATYGVFFKSDGTKMYTTGNGTDAVHQYTLATAWDLSTASYDSVSFDVSGQDTLPIDIFFKDDGTKMYILNDIFIHQYSTVWTGVNNPTSGLPVTVTERSLTTTKTVSTVFWDVVDSISATDAQNDGKLINYAISTDGRNTWSVYNSNGTERKIVRNNSGVYEVNTNPEHTGETWVPAQTNDYKSALHEQFNATPIDISWQLDELVNDNSSSDINFGETSSLRGLFFKPDGSKLYLIDVNETIYQYSLSTAWDPSTASYDSVSFNVFSQDFTAEGIFFKDDGTKMYMVGSYSDSVYQYTLATAWDLSTATYDSVSFNVGSQDSFPTGVSFKPDGTKMYIVGSSNDSVYQYTLSTAWDISSASYDSVSFVSTPDTWRNPNGIFFKQDGTELYVALLSYGVVQYTLSTAWDISTATLTSDNAIQLYKSDSNSSRNASGVFFKPEGDRFWLSHYYYDGGGIIHQYDINTEFNPNTVMGKDGIPVININGQLGTELDLAIGLQHADTGAITSNPTFSGLDFVYDTKAKNALLVNGTDYVVEHDGSSIIEFKPTTNGTYNIRII